MHEAHDGDDRGIVLYRAFEPQGVVIGAARATGVFAAGLGASFVDGAAARSGMKELARLAEEGVLGAFERPRLVDDGRVFADGFFDGNTEMRRDAFDVEVGNFDTLVNRAAERNAFRAIVM